MKKKNPTSVRLTVDSVVLKAAVMCGTAGRYISSDSGTIMFINAMRTIMKRLFIERYSPSTPTNKKGPDKIANNVRSLIRSLLTSGE